MSRSLFLFHVWTWKTSPNLEATVTCTTCTRTKTIGRVDALVPAQMSFDLVECQPKAARGFGDG